MIELFFQVYIVDESKWNGLCLSATAEMGIAYYLKHIKLNQKQLPIKLAAVSRCFRAETSKISEEKGIYRFVTSYECISFIHFVSYNYN